MDEPYVTHGRWRMIVNAPAICLLGFTALLGGCSDKATILLNNPRDPEAANYVAPWQTAPSMPTARQGLAAVNVDGKVYVVGGWKDTRLNTLEIYDPATKSWTTGEPMPTARR